MSIKIPGISEEQLDLLRKNFDTFLRRSYLIVAGLIVAGCLVNIFLPHGWTIWPFVGAVGMLLMVHEAAERNGQGIPPMRVYAFFGVALGSWIVITLVLSALNFFIIFLGIGAMTYYAVRAYLVQRDKDQVIQYRKLNRLCVHCGEPADPTALYCENCCEEPNPEALTSARIAAIAKSPDSIARARANLTPAPPTSGVKAKENALINRRQRAGPVSRSYQGNKNSKGNK